MRKVCKKALSYILTLVMLSTMLAVGGLTLSFSAESGAVLFSENFDATPNGTLPDGWVVASPSGVTDIAVQDGGLVITAAHTSDAQTGVVYMGDELKNYGDYTFEADYTVLDADYLPLSSSTRYSSMMFRINGTTLSGGRYAPYYYVTARTKPEVTDELTAQKTDGTYYQIVRNAQSQTMVVNQTYHLKVVCRGTNIQFYIDDSMVFNQTLETDSSSYPYLTAGTIGFNTSNMTVRFDNVVVREEAAATQTQPALYDTYIPKTDLADAPSVIANVTSSSVLASVSGNKLPSTTFYYVNKDLNVTTPDGTTVITSLGNALNKTNGKVIPALYIRDTATVTALKSFVSEVALQDAFLVSDSTEILKYARQQMPSLYGVLYYRLTTAADEKTLADMVSDTNSSLGKTILTDAAYISKENVAYLQKRLMNVWVIGDLDNTGIYENIYKGVNGIICENHTALLNAVESFNSGIKTVIRTPFIVGHRGYMTQYPQNTMASFRGAVENGADLVETDVRRTSDGVIVLYHDEYLYTLTSCTDSSKTVENSTYNELMQYTVNYANGNTSSEKIPTLREWLQYLDTTDDVVGIIEIKNNTDSTLVTETANIIKELGMTDQVVSIAFDGTQANRMRTALPGVSTGLLANYNSNYTTVNSIINWTKSCTTQYNTTFHPNTGVVYSGTSLRTDLLAAASQRGINYFPWTYIDQARFDTSFVGGVQSFTTNYMEYGNTYVRAIEATANYAMAANTATTLTAVGQTALGTQAVNCSVMRIGGDAITFRYSAGKVTADKEGTATAVLLYKSSTKSAGSYYTMSAPVTITVSEGAEPIPTEELRTSLLPSSAAEWTNSISNMNIDAVLNADGSHTLTNTTGNWPAVDNTLTGMKATLDDHIAYDVTVGSRLSIVLLLGDGSSVQIQKYFEGNNTFDGDDIIGNGATFTGVVDLYDCIPASAVDQNGEFTISTVRIFNIGSAGTEVVVRTLDLVQDVPVINAKPGDVNGDGNVSVADARMILKVITGSSSFTIEQSKAADLNGDGRVNTLDVRKLLAIVVNSL